MSGSVSRRRVVPVLLAVTLGVGESGCTVLGPSCTERQRRGFVMAISGEVEANQVVSHLVPYDRRGSQNDVSIDWIGRGQAGGPRLRVYATPVACTNFLPPPARNSGACAEIVGSAGGSCAQPGPTCSDEDLIQGSIIVAKGPGNGPHDFTQYRLHVLGDATQRVSYSISLSYWSGPDC